MYPNDALPDPSIVIVEYGNCGTRRFETFPPLSVYSVYGNSTAQAYPHVQDEIALVNAFLP